MGGKLHFTGNAEAESGVGLESSVRRKHVNGGRFEWEFAREEQSAVIVTTTVW